jgi:N-acetylglucosaminyl-diphospho-decaprenol L-rhamnosyltransferase
MVDLAVVVVTWNVRALVLEALATLFADLAQSGLTADVYVVDSASSDGTPDEVRRAFPQVKLTASAQNLGFGAANNVAIRQIMAHDPPPVVYLLNPDTRTHPGATMHLYRHLLSDARIGLVGAQLAYEDGTFQHGAFGFPGLRQLWAEFFPTPGRFIEGRFNGRYPQQVYERGDPFPVDLVLGATMMLRREVIAATGMFDEGFFMYCEEIDWAWRIHKAGWRVESVPGALVTHFAAKSTSQVRPQMLIHLWTSRLRLYHKHHAAIIVIAARLLIALGMAAKARRVPPGAERDAYRTVLRMALGR